MIFVVRSSVPPDAWHHPSRRCGASKTVEFEAVLVLFEGLYHGEIRPVTVFRGAQR